jgi:hypothetical protein
MPKLSELLAEKAKAELTVGGSTLHVTFYVLWRERFSDEEWTDLLALKGRDYLRAILPKIVLDWDVVDDDDHAIPVTAEAFDQHDIPDALLIAIERRTTGSDLSGKVISSN